MATIVKRVFFFAIAGGVVPLVWLGFWKAMGRAESLSMGSISFIKKLQYLSWPTSIAAVRHGDAEMDAAIMTLLIALNVALYAIIGLAVALFLKSRITKKS